MNRGAGDPLSILYVRDIIADTTSAVYGMLKDGCADGRNGTIAVIGQEEDALSLTGRLVSFDCFDNVDGRRSPDGLQDFAGEIFAVISDNANAPYRGYKDKDNVGFLKELTVKNFLGAVDTVCASSQFDSRQSVRKPASKAVILASSYSSAFGYRDICALTSAAHSNVKVISPLHSMFRYAVSRYGEKGAFAVWTSDDILGAGVFSGVWETMAEEYPALRYDAFCPVRDQSLRERILSFFRMYKASGKQRQIDAVLVDDAPLTAEMLNSALTTMIQNSDDSLAVYRNFLADKFEFIDAAVPVAQECYMFLRQANLFTHRVAYPSMSMYLTVAIAGMAAQDYDQDGNFTDDFKYNRAEDSDYRTYLIVENREDAHKEEHYVSE